MRRDERTNGEPSTLSVKGGRRANEPADKYSATRISTGATAAMFAAVPSEDTAAHAATVAAGPDDLAVTQHWESRLRNARRASRKRQRPFRPMLRPKRTCTIPYVSVRTRTIRYDSVRFGAIRYDPARSGTFRPGERANGERNSGERTNGGGGRRANQRRAAETRQGGDRSVTTIRRGGLEPPTR